MFAHELTEPRTDTTKRLGHDLVVEKKTSEKIPIPMKIQRKIVALDSCEKRRIALCRTVKLILPRVKAKIPPEQLQRYGEIRNAKRSKKEAYEFCSWLVSQGITAKMVNTATNSQMGSHYCCSRTGTQPAIPTFEMAEKIRPLLKGQIPDRWAWVFSSSREQLERLEQLEQLQRLEQCSYNDVEIPAGAIIYCDPPYKGTAGYVANNDDFDHDEFYRWCREKSKTNPVFISEYTAPDDFECVYEFERRQNFNVSSVKTQNEKVFLLRTRKTGG